MLRQLAVPLCMVVPVACLFAAAAFTSKTAGSSLSAFYINCTDPLTPLAGRHAFFGSSGFHERQID